VIFDYLSVNRGKYPLKDLKGKIISKGYSEQSFNDALAALRGSTPIKKEGEMSPSWESMLFKFAGIFGLVFVVCGLVSIILGILEIPFKINSSLATGIFIAGLILAGVYFYGFVKLGRKTYSKFLKVSSILSIVIIVILLGFYAFAVLTKVITLTGEGTGNYLPGGGSSFVGYMLLAFLLFILVVRYLFTISLIRIRNVAKFSNIAGVLGLIVVVIVTLIVGYLTYLVLNPEAFLIFIFSVALNPTKLLIYTWILRGVGFVFLTGVLFESLLLLKASRKAAEV